MAGSELNNPQHADWELKEQQLSDGVAHLDLFSQKAFQLTDVASANIQLNNGHGYAFHRTEHIDRITSRNREGVYYEFSIDLGEHRKGFISFGQKTLDGSNFAIINFPEGPNVVGVEAIEPIEEWLRNSFDEARSMPRQQEELTSLA